MCAPNRSDNAVLMVYFYDKQKLKKLKAIWNAHYRSFCESTSSVYILQETAMIHLKELVKVM